MRPQPVPCMLLAGSVALAVMLLCLGGAPLCNTMLCSQGMHMLELSMQQCQLTKHMLSMCCLQG